LRFTDLTSSPIDHLSQGFAFNFSPMFL